MGLAERFPFDFAQGRLSTSGRDTRPAKASGTERTCFARENAKASRPSAPLGFAPFMEFFRVSRAGSVTMQKRKSGVEPPHSKDRGEQQIPRCARDDNAGGIPSGEGGALRRGESLRMGHDGCFPARGDRGVDPSAAEKRGLRMTAGRGKRRGPACGSLISDWARGAAGRFD